MGYIMYKHRLMGYIHPCIKQILMSFIYIYKCKHILICYIIYKCILMYYIIYKYMLMVI